MPVQARSRLPAVSNSSEPRAELRMDDASLAAAQRRGRPHASADAGWRASTASRRSRTATPYSSAPTSCWSASSGARVGHKIGGTTEAMRRYINVPEPLAGEVFANQVHEDGATVRRSDFVRLGIETEIAVRLAAATCHHGRSPTRATTRRAPSRRCMAPIELVDDRYDDFARSARRRRSPTTPSTPASCWAASATGLARLDLAVLTARTRRDGTLMAEGRSDALLGHPMDALAWLATKRSRLGLGLNAGTFVTLGTITPVQWVDAPGVFQIEIDSLGAVAVTVA